MKADAEARNLPPIYRGRWARASAEEVAAEKAKVRPGGCVYARYSLSVCMILSQCSEAAVLCCCLDAGSVVRSALRSHAGDLYRSDGMLPGSVWGETLGILSRRPELPCVLCGWRLRRARRTATASACRLIRTSSSPTGFAATCASALTRSATSWSCAAAGCPCTTSASRSTTRSCASRTSSARCAADGSFFLGMFCPSFLPLSMRPLWASVLQHHPCARADAYACSKVSAALFCTGTAVGSA